MNKITKETVNISIEEFYSSTQDQKNKIIDNFFDNQPNIIQLFEANDNLLSLPAREILICTACIIWLTFSKTYKSIPETPNDIVIKCIKFNSILHERVSTGDDFLIDSLENYKEQEILQFIIYTVTKHFINNFQDEAEATTVLFCLKMIADSFISVLIGNVIKSV